MQVSVTIGRNIDADPMPEARWAEFIVATAGLLTGPLAAEFKVGEWEGVAEDSVTLTGWPKNDAWLVEDLASLARKFDQDAIAFHREGARWWVLIFHDGHSEIGWEA